MKIYHYTTIDSLAMIMSSRSIKFNRLDNVDDKEECVEPSNAPLWQYVFVSCWTENNEESIPLWRMYSGNAHGVRIGMEIDMFEDYKLDVSKLPLGIPSLCKIPEQDLLRTDYFIMPASSQSFNVQGDTLFYCHVDYVDDVKEETKDAYEFIINDSTHASSRTLFGKIGKCKDKRWAFQEESRFRIVALPFNPILCDPSMASTVVVNSFHNNIPVPISEYYMKLKSEVLRNIEITLHPNISTSDRVIVEALCAKYAPEATVRDSELSGKVSLK